LHRVQVRQLVPASAVEAEGLDLDALAGALRAEVVQLWYQMALAGRRELPLAPSARAGFEMSVLRMLAFRPLEGAAAAPGAAPAAAEPAGSGRSAAAAARAALEAAPAPAAAPRRREAPAAKPADAPGPAPEAPPPSVPQPRAARKPPATPAATVDIDTAGWPDLLERLSLRGQVRELAMHTALVGYANGVLELSLPPSDDHLKAPFLVGQLAEALASHFGAVPKIRFSEAAPADGETLHERQAREQDARHREAESAFMGDPDVQKLMSRPGAAIVPD